MKLIEAMKKLKSLAIKAEDYRTKIAQHCAVMSFETPTYQNQGQEVTGWLQGHSDILKEMLALRIAIQRTNLATPVTIELDGVAVTKSIAEWIHRRRDLAALDREAWLKLTDRGLKEQRIKTAPGGPETDTKIVRFYSPEIRDEKIELYRTEPLIIDATLETVNAITDLIE